MTRTHTLGLATLGTLAIAIASSGAAQTKPTEAAPATEPAPTPGHEAGVAGGAASGARRSADPKAVEAASGNEAVPVDAAKPGAGAMPEADARGPMPAAASAPAPSEGSTSRPMTDEERRRIGQERARVRALLERVRHERTAREGPRPAEAPRVYGDAGAPRAIGVVAELGWNTDPGYDYFDDDDVGERLGVWVAHDLLSFTPAIILAVELGWETGGEDASGLQGDRLSTQLDTHAFHAGVQLRHVLLPWLSPQLRVAGGLAFLDVTLTTLDDSVVFEDQVEWDPFASAGVGVLLRTPPRLFEDRRGQRASLALGLLIEGGYTHQAPSRLTLDGPGGGDRAIPLRDADLGELDRAGPYLRGSLVVRF